MKKSFAIAMSLAVVAFIGCGGGGGSSSEPNNSDVKISTDSATIEAKITSELANATSTQKAFMGNYGYYGYMKTTQGYNVEKDGTTYYCEGVNFAGANKRVNDIFLATIDNENDTLEDPVPKVGDKYTFTIDDSEAKATMELHFIENEKYLIGAITSYEKEVNKSCKREIYLKKR